MCLIVMRIGLTIANRSLNEQDMFMLWAFASTLGDSPSHCLYVCSKTVGFPYSANPFVRNCYYCLGTWNVRCEVRFCDSGDVLLGMVRGCRRPETWRPGSLPSENQVCFVLLSGGILLMWSILCMFYYFRLDFYRFWTNSKIFFLRTTTFF